VLRGEWAGHKCKVMAVQQDGTLVVSPNVANGAPKLPLQILQSADCGRIVPRHNKIVSAA